MKLAHSIKKRFARLSLLVFWFVSLPVLAVSYGSDFALPLVAWEKVYSSLSNVDVEKPFTENLRDIFYPPIWQWDGGLIWSVLRYIGVWVLVIMIIWTGSMFVRGAAEPEEQSSALRSLIYLVYWAFIFFWATRILGTVINIWDFSGLVEGEDSIINKAEEWIVLQVIAAMKAVAFFVAIWLVVWYWSRMIFASGEDDKIKAARTWLLNVVIALVFIKIIDFLYFIAQSGEFEWLAVETIVNVAKFLWFIFGMAIFLSLLYVWFVFLTSAWNDDRITKAKTLVKNIVIVMLVVMLFLLVMFQIFSEIPL